MLLAAGERGKDRTWGFQEVWKGALGRVERGSVVEGRSLAPEPLPHTQSQVADRAEMELVELLVEERRPGEDQGWDPSLQEDDPEEGRSLEASPEEG